MLYEGYPFFDHHASRDVARTRGLWRAAPIGHTGPASA